MPPVDEKQASAVDIAERIIETLDRKITAPYQKVVFELTPKYFDWLGWVAALAALQYVYVKTGNWAVMALMAVGYLSSFFYLNLIFTQIFEKLLYRTRPLVQKLLSGSLGASLMFGVSHVIRDAVDAMASSP